MAFSDTSPSPTPNDALGAALSRRVVLRWEVVVYALILIAAVFTRFWALGDRAMSHDESLHVYYSYNLYLRGDFDHTPLMHGPILFHANALMYALFGDNDFSGRIYTALLGVAMVFTPLLFQRWIGKWGALLACVMILVSPLLMYYNRYIREDTPAIMASLLMAWAILMYLNGPAEQRRKPRWLYVLSAAMLWNLGTKETAFMYVASFGLFFTLYWIVRMLQVRYQMAGKPIFSGLIMAILLGAFAAVPMYIILDIAPPTDMVSAAIRASETPVMQADGSVVMQTTGSVWDALTANPDWGSFVSWSLLSLVVVVLLVYGTLRWAFRGRHIPWEDLAIFLVVALLALSALIFIEELSHIRNSDAVVQTVTPTDPNAPAVALEGEGGINWLVVAIPWVALGILGFLLWRSRQRGWWDWLDQFPELDVLIVMGALILPWLTAIFILGAGGSNADYAAIGTAFSGVAGLLPVTGELQIGKFVVGLLCFLPLFTLALIGGLTWNWRRFLVCWLIFHALFVFFFTTVFTNIYGLHSGMVYSLQYWMEQQAERRGGQPQYYYFLIILPMYEFLPIIGSFAASLTGLYIYWRRRRSDLELKDKLDSFEKTKTDTLELAEATQNDDHTTQQRMREQADALREEWRERNTLREASGLMFISWWAVTIMFALTLAGEKMPWLGTHMTTPMILITGWYFGRIVQRVRWATVKSYGWVLMLLFVLGLAALVRVLAGYVTEEIPFAGQQQFQLVYTYNFLGALVVLGAVVLGVYWVLQRTSGVFLRQMFAVTALTVLGLVTLRSAWQASFVNYDYPNEFLVYAHATPNTKTVIDLMEDFSRRTTDGMGLSFAYDNKLSWPGVWYFRRFTNAIYMGETPTLQQMEQANIVLVGEANRNMVEPLLEERYQRFDFKRMWWPMQDYFGLNPTRINDLLELSERPQDTSTPSTDFSEQTSFAEDVDSGRLRRALFEIWWNKDYTLYGQVTNKEFGFDRWPVSENFYMYVRKDFAAQLWPYGTGDGSVTNPIDVTETSLCVANWLDYPAVADFALGMPNGALAVPIGLDVAPDGRVYVAEDQGYRISIFDQDGAFLQSVGQRGAASQEGVFFERPHSIRMAPDGTLYVVDTWNYQIRRFTADWQPLGRWGSPITVGIDAPTEPTDGLWGPRDLAIDPDGNVYVADTGNKRVRVYDPNGVWLRDIGKGGSGDGQLDEPTGLAVHAGRLYVADTWNRRIAVFGLDGIWQTNIPVRAWYGEPFSRPYLTIDPERSLLYVADPEGGRILVYDLNGECVGAFGRLNTEFPALNEFAAIGGIDVDGAGNVYVVDLTRGRLLKFPPFPLTSVEPVGLGDAIGVPLDLGDEGDPALPAVTPEVSAEVEE